MFQHRIHNREHFSHTGHQVGHIQRGSDWGSPTPNRAPAFQCTAVAGERGHAHQRGNLFVCQRSQFGQLGNHRATHNRANPWDALQHIHMSFPDRTAANCLIQIAIELS